MLPNNSERTSHRFKQSLFVNERDLDNGFQILFLRIEIQLKVERVEMDNR
jgi:hypothetical protein